MSRDYDPISDEDIYDFLEKYNFSEYERYISDLPLRHIDRKFILSIEVWFDDGSREYLDGDSLLCNIDLRKDLLFDVIESFPKPVGFKTLIDTKKIGEQTEYVYREIINSL